MCILSDSSEGSDGHCLILKPKKNQKSEQVIRVRQHLGVVGGWLTTHLFVVLDVRPVGSRRQSSSQHHHGDKRLWCKRSTAVPGGRPHADHQSLKGPAAWCFRHLDGWIIQGFVLLQPSFICMAAVDWVQVHLDPNRLAKNINRSSGWASRLCTQST